MKKKTSKKPRNKTNKTQCYCCHNKVDADTVVFTYALSKFEECFPAVCSDCDKALKFFEYKYVAPLFGFDIRGHYAYELCNELKGMPKK